MGQLDGKVAVITGAASGIGAATARAFVAEGAAVVVADLDLERAQTVAASLGTLAAAVHVDVAEEGAIEVAIDHALEHFGGLDVMFNNAGNPGTLGSILDLEAESFDRTLAVHLRGVFLGLRAAARVMVPQGRGSIINTSSVAALRANYAGHDYSAAKAAILHLSETAANELGEYGVRVNAICPGVIATAIFGRAAGLDGDAAQATAALVREGMADLAPIRRAGAPEDIAAAAVFLAGDASSYVNGQRLVVDGGLISGRTYRESMANLPELLGALRGDPLS